MQGTLRNAVFGLGGFAVSIGAGILYTPYLVGRLGVTSYGLVPLVMSLFVWANWIALAVTWSVGRYVTLAYAQRDEEEIKRVFNTTLVAAAVVCAGIVAVSLALAPFVQSIIRLPPGAERAAKILLVCGGLSTALTILSSVVEVSFYCLNRFDFRAILQIARSLGAIALVVVLFELARPRLEWIGVASCVVLTGMLAVTYLWGRRLLPALSISAAHFRLSTLKAMMGTNVWILVDQLGTLLILNMNLLIVNRCFGATASAEFALAAQWENMLKAVIAGVSVFTPTFVLLVGRNDIGALRAASLRASRFVGFIVAVAGALLIGFASDLPRIWLHSDNLQISLLIVGLVLPVIANAAVVPLYGVWHAFNRVRVPCVVTLATGVCSIGLSLLLVKFTTLGPWSVIVGSGLTFTLRNLAFSLYYVSRLVHEPVTSYIGVLARSWMGAAALVAVSLWLSKVLSPGSWIALAGASLIAFLLVSPLYWGAVFNGEDRQTVRAWLRRRLELVANPGR